MEEACQIDALIIEKQSKVKGPLARFGQRTQTHSFIHLFKKCWVPIIYKAKIGMLTMSIRIWS